MAGTRSEEIEVSGEKLVAAVKQIVHEGNIRRISIRSSAGVTLIEIPLVVGLAGAVFAPVWAAIGAIAALVANCRLVVERTGGTPAAKPRKRTATRKPASRKATPRKAPRTAARARTRAA